MASGSFSSSNVLIGATAAQIITGNARRESVLIQNVHASQILYVGHDANVTTGNGIRLLAGESIELKSGAPIFGIASGADTDVRYMEMR